MNPHMGVLFFIGEALQLRCDHEQLGGRQKLVPPIGGLLC